MIASSAAPRSEEDLHLGAQGHLPVLARPVGEQADARHVKRNRIDVPDDVGGPLPVVLAEVVVETDSDGAVVVGEGAVEVEPLVPAEELELVGNEVDAALDHEAVLVEVGRGVGVGIAVASEDGGEEVGGAELELAVEGPLEPLDLFGAGAVLAVL